VADSSAVIPAKAGIQLRVVDNWILAQGFAGITEPDQVCPGVGLSCIILVLS
jgi:hypothetical protein